MKRPESICLAVGISDLDQANLERIPRFCAVAGMHLRRRVALVQPQTFADAGLDDTALHALRPVPRTTTLPSFPDTPVNRAVQALFPTHEGYDKAKLENGVLEPLREFGLIEDEQGQE